MSYSPLQLAEAYLQAGELADALEVLNEHLATTPDDEALRLRSAILSRDTEREALQRAVADLNLLTNITPDDLMMRSTLHSKLGENTAALDIIRTAHAQFPAHDRITERLLYLLREGSLINEAQELVAKLPESWRWSQWAGDFARDADDLPAAITHYSTAIHTLEAQHDPRNPDAPPTIKAVYARLCAARADAYDRAGALGDAEADYALALALIPDDTLIQLSRGILIAKRGDVQSSVQMCEAALNAMPESLRRTYALPRLHTAPYPELQQLAAGYTP